MIKVHRVLPNLQAIGLELWYSVVDVKFITYYPYVKMHENAYK